MAIDLYFTLVVDISGKGDYTDLQTAIDNLPAAGGKIFVKAGVYPINAGYNPVGTIPDPWPASGGGLTNDITAGSPNPQSGTPSNPSLRLTTLN